MRPFGRLDVHRRLIGMSRVCDRRDRHAAEQAAFDQPAPGVVDRAVVVDLSGAPLDTILHIGRVEPFQPGDRGRAELHARAGVERIGHRHRLRIVIDDDATFGLFSERVALAPECGEQRVLGCNYRLGTGRIAGFQRQARRVRIGRHHQRFAAGTPHIDRRRVIQRPGLHRDGDLGRVCLQVDVVGELRVPVTEAVGRLFQAFEIVIGASPQCFFGSRLLVLEFLELRDIVEQVREVGVVGPHDLRLIGDIGRNRHPAGEETDTSHHQEACSPSTPRR